MWSTWNFIKRHKGKIIVASGVVGGAVMLNKYLSSWEKAWDKSSSRDFISEVKKKEIHFENTIDTCNTTCMSLSGKILDILDSVLDAEPILAQIKKYPERKVELFHELKVRIFTRVISEVYCLVLFVAYLRVQLSIIAGYMYVESCNTQSNGFKSLNGSSSSCISPSSSAVQQKYISLLSSFYQDGINQIVEPVQSAVEDAMKEMSLKEKVVLKDLKHVFDKVKSSMAFTLSATSEGNASRFLLNPDRLLSQTTSSNDDPIASTSSNYNNFRSNGSIGPTDRNGHATVSSKEAAVLQRMLAETQDILESEDFQRVLDAGVDIGFSIVMDLLLGCFVRLGQDETQTNGKNTQEMSFSNPHSIHIPLAKLLPSLRNALTNRKSPDEKLVLVRHLICLDVLNCFAANIYEAFCQSEQNNVKEK